jgi:hypothetical protein
MITFGIDVIILAMFGLALVLASYIAAVLVPLSQEGGMAAIVSTAITAISMIVAYIIMAHVLDNVLGYMGW